MQRNMSPMVAGISRAGEAPASTASPATVAGLPGRGSSPARSTCTCVVVVVGAGEVLPRKVERKPGCGERPPWPVGPSQTVRRTGRCRGRSPSCCRRRQLRHRRRQLPHHLRPCTASRRPHAPTDLGNPGCTEKMRKTKELSYRTRCWSSRGPRGFVMRVKVRIEAGETEGESCEDVVRKAEPCSYHEARQLFARLFTSPSFFRDEASVTLEEVFLSVLAFKLLEMFSREGVTCCDTVEEYALAVIRGEFVCDLVMRKSHTYSDKYVQVNVTYLYVYI